MTPSREQVRRRVRELVRTALEDAGFASLGGSGAAPRPGPAQDARGGEVVTERDVVQRLREGRPLEFPEGTRLTPLAREVVDEHRRRLAADDRNRDPAPMAPAPVEGSRDGAIPPPGSGSGTPGDPAAASAAASRAGQPADGRPAAGRPAAGDTEHRRPGPRETVAVGADHGGFALKEALAEHLRTRGFEVLDCGTHDDTSCDYPVFARRVAEAIRDGAAAAGLVVDGAGIGSAMTVNKMRGVRAAHCHNVVEARNAREHNHAHVLTLGAGIVGPLLAREILDCFLATPFAGGRHARRVALIEGREESAGVSAERG